MNIELTRNPIKNQRDRAMLNPSHIGIKRNDQADSAGKAAWKMPIGKSFKIPYTGLKIEINFTPNKWQLS